MTPGDARKLLGGYAAGNLSEEERRRLFEAALEDQELFDALAEEESLRDLLADPAVRGRLARALEPARKAAWFRRRLNWALTGSLAASLVVAGVVWRKLNQPVAKPAVVAVARIPAAPAAAPAAREPVPERRRPRARVEPGVPPKAQSEAGQMPGAGAPGTSQPAAMMAEADAGAPRPGLETGVVGGVLAPERPAFLATRSPAPTVRYVFFKQDAEGRWTTALAGVRFRSRDQIRVTLMPASDGELQVRLRDPEGIWRPLLSPGYRVRAGSAYTIPHEGAFTLSGPGGVRLEVVFTPAGGAPALTQQITIPTE